MLLQQFFNLTGHLLHFGRLQRIVNFYHVAFFIYQRYKLRVQKIIVDRSKVIGRVVNFISVARHAVQAVFTAGKEHPLRRIYLHAVGIALQLRRVVGSRVAGVRKDHEIFFSFKLVVHHAHIVVHARANAFAGGKKIFYRGYFALYVLFGKRGAILVGKGKRCYLADGRDVGLCKAWNQQRHNANKSKKQHNKKQDIVNTFAAHTAKVAREPLFYIQMRLYLTFEKFFMKKLMFGVALLFSLSAMAQGNDETTIRQTLTDQTRSWNSGDLESFMQPYWKSDSLMFVGKNGVVWGWQPTLDNYKKGYPNKDAMGQLSFDIIQVKKLSADYYHVTGKWMLKRTIGDVSGHYTLLLRRIGGAWKIVYDHSS